MSAELTAPGVDLRWWADYLRGRWLEDFTRLAMTDAARALGVPVEAESAVTLVRGLATLELDVLAFVGYRPHVISCANTANGRTARSKAYGAERRAWQLVTTMGEAAVPRREMIEAIFDEPLELYRSTDLKLFGRPQLEEWRHALDAGRGAESIARWLESGLGIPSRT